MLEHLSLVSAIAARILRRLPIAVDIDDLFQAGVVGLLDALEQYDASKNTSFDGYAKDHIKAAIVACLGQFDCTSPRLRKHHNLRAPIASHVALDLARDQPDGETAERMAEKTNWRTEFQRRLKPLRAAGGFSRRDREGCCATPDAAGTPESLPDRICERNELRRALTLAVGHLPRRDRRVLNLSYGDEMSLGQIGGLFGVSGNRISQIRKRAVQQMCTELRSGGFAPRGRPVILQARLATYAGTL